MSLDGAGGRSAGKRSFYGREGPWRFLPMQAALNLYGPRRDRSESAERQTRGLALPLEEPEEDRRAEIEAGRENSIEEDEP